MIRTMEDYSANMERMRKEIKALKVDGMSSAAKCLKYYRDLLKEKGDA